MNGSGAGIADEHDQPGMCISIDQIESLQCRLISVIKGSQTSRTYITLPQYLLTNFINLPMYISVKAQQQMNLLKQNMHLNNMQQHLL